MRSRAVRLMRAVVAAAALLVIVAGLVVGENRHQDRVESLSSRLRCPVCSGESIADSESETARQLRQVVAEQVAEGRSDAEIRAWFVDRYSEWILLDPPARGRGLLLWLAPLVALLIGIGAVASRRRRGPPDRPATPAPAAADEPAPRVAASEPAP